MDGLIGFSSEASKGSFNSVIKVSGVVESYERVPAPASFKGFPDAKTGVVKPPADQLKMTLLDPVFVEMADGEEEPDVKNDRYVIYMNYAPPGKQPHVSSGFVNGFVKSAEAIWIDRGDCEVVSGNTKATKNYLNFKGEVVTMEYKQAIELPFKKEGSEEKATAKGWVFINNEDEGGLSEVDHIANLIRTKNLPSAKRALLTDAKARRNSKWRAALDDGTLADMVGLVLSAKGIFVDAE